MYKKKSGNDGNKWQTSFLKSLVKPSMFYCSHIKLPRHMHTHMVHIKNELQSHVTATCGVTRKRKTIIFCVERNLAHLCTTQSYIEKQEFQTTGARHTHVQQG